jgi:hypothetical protein
MQPTLLKYPRTQHLQGSRLQPGDEDLDQIPLSSLRGAHLVIEEKMDGANCGLSFSPQGELQLQSRGHYLTGGPRERHFALLKTWAQTLAEPLYDAIGDRYVVYGEWLYAKHTVFYDALPHYFMEFDVYDRHEARFLCTRRRKALLGHLPLVPVHVLYEGPSPGAKELQRLIGPSRCKTARWREALTEAALHEGQDPAQVRAQTDDHDQMEGLYLKWEADGQVQGRYKFVRASFHAALAASGSHWQRRPILPNRLSPGIDLFNTQP